MEAYALKLVRLGIDTLHEFIVYMRSDCDVCKSEGFEAETQVLVTVNHQFIIATLNVIHSDLLKIDEASLSESAWAQLNGKEGDFVTISHPAPVTSLSYIRSKIYGHELKQSEFDEIINDIVLRKYSNTHLASFITACARDNLNFNEIVYLTQSMIKVGQRLHWNYPYVMDKHSVGGIPGNRTTPIVVAIVASAGLIIPKTSSRAITSPAGTADTIETMTSINLTAAQIRQVVDKEGGCMVWGGALGLSPADDIIIRVERSLDLDPEGQLIASVLSKKAAVGATHVVIDIPVGPTAKIRTEEAFLRLKDNFNQIGKACGLEIHVIKTDGIQPVGTGIGPALEAKDILAILNNEKNIPIDLKEKSIEIAGILLELGKVTIPGNGNYLARNILEKGSALKKFLAICEAQGGFREPTTAKYTFDILSNDEGYVTKIDNRNLSLIAKLAGAPHDPAAGIELFAKCGSYIKNKQLLYRIHAETKGELEYAIKYANSMPEVIILNHDMNLF